MIRFTVNVLPLAFVALSPAALALIADIHEALRESRLKQEAAALDMGVTPQRLSEFFGGKSPLDVRRLAALDHAFWRALIGLLADRHGITVVDDDIAQLVVSVKQLLHIAPDRSKLAKAELSPAYGRAVELPLSGEKAS